MKNFFLKNAQDFEADENSVLFANNIEMYQGESGSHIMDKRMYKENDNYKTEFIKMNNGIQKIMVSRMSEVDSDVIEIISSLVLNILTSITEYLKFCDMKIEFETSALITIRNS